MEMPDGAKPIDWAAEAQRYYEERAALRGALQDIMSYIDAGQDPPWGQRPVPITIIQQARDALRKR